MLIYREVHLRRQQEGRELIDRILVIVLGKKEQAGLPFHGNAVSQMRRGTRSRGKAYFLGKLEILLIVVTPYQRRRRIVQVGQISGLPVDKSRSSGESEALAFA